MKLGTVKSTIAPMFATPDKNAPLIDEVIHGYEVKLMYSYNEFYFVNTFYDYEGYVEKKHIEEGIFDNLKKMTVSHYFADVKKSEDVRAREMQGLVKGSIVSLDSKLETRYTKVRLTESQKGYIRTQFLSEYKIPNLTPIIHNAEQLRNDIVNTALEYLNVQYKWGGKTSLGIDCSGLCFMSYLLNGIVIYRDAKIVDRFPVKQIPVADVKKGDLLYSKTHVAIYLGDEKFIHSSDRFGVVQINSMNPTDPDYDEVFVQGITYAGSCLNS